MSRKWGEELHGTACVILVGHKKRTGNHLMSLYRTLREHPRKEGMPKYKVCLNKIYCCLSHSETKYKWHESLVFGMMVKTDTRKLKLDCACVWWGHGLYMCCNIATDVPYCTWNENLLHNHNGRMSFSIPPNLWNIWIIDLCSWK